MSQGLEKLKALGIQRVHQETHISSKNIEAIFNESFDEINKVQFIGFLSILEREYHIDLNDVKVAFMEQWNARHDAQDVEETIAPPRPIEGDNRKIVMAAFIIAALVIIIFQFVGSKAPIEPIPAMNTTQLTPSPSPTVIAAPQEVPVGAPLVEVPPPEVSLEVKSLTIIPRAKLWVGMIDLETFRKDQQLTSEAIAIDTNRSWLLLFGHGFFHLEHGEERLSFSEENQVRFIYEDGMLRPLTRDEFKMRNQGQLW